MSELAPWLSASQWPTVPIRHVARLGTGHTPSRQHPEYWQDCHIPWITLGDVWQLRDGSRQVITETAEKISAVGVANSAAVVHPARSVILSRTASVGFSAVMGADMATSQDFAVWTCGPRLLPEFLLYVLRAMAPDLRRVAAGSTHKTVYMPDIEQLRTPLPPIEAQRAVVAWLDGEAASEEWLRTQRTQQAELLSEYAVSLIYAAFSEPDHRERKNTGTPWLPNIPAGWPLPAVGHAFDVRLGKMLSPQTTSGPNQRPYLRNANISWDRLNLSDVATMHFEADEVNSYSVKAGDLLVCEGGAGIAEAAVWDGSIEECYYQKSLHRVRPKADVPVRWLLHWLRLAKHLGVFTGGNVATIPHLTGEQLRAYRIPTPPDVRIRLQRLDAQLADVYELDRPLTDWRAKLAEHRNALITSAVTGQIDLTGKAA